MTVSGARVAVLRQDGLRIETHPLERVHEAIETADYLHERDEHQGQPLGTCA